MRVTRWPRVFRVAGATLMTLGLAWCCVSCSPAPGGVSSSTGVALARPGGQLWASTLPAGCCPVGAVSPDGRTVFISGYVKTHFETVAYSAATGARLWARAYQPPGYSVPRAITVSPDGTTVYVTGDNSSGSGDPTVAYDAATGKQLWVSRYNGAYLWAVAVSPDGTTLYVTGRGHGSGRNLELVTIAYAAATGKERWRRYYASVEPGSGASVAVSPDGKTIYATGGDGSYALTVAYQANGTLKWASRYKNPYGGFAYGYQIVAGPGGDTVYVVGSATNKSGHIDLATFAYRAGTGRLMWLDRHVARGEGGQIAVTPDGRTVLVTGPENGNGAHRYVIAAYNTSTGGARWARRAPAPAMSPGLVVDPHGHTVFIASMNNLTAYSVAHGTVLWTRTYHAKEPTPIALRGDGTRLFVTGWWPGRGITTAAYQS